jgi:hypothetical protein
MPFRERLDQLTKTGSARLFPLALSGCCTLIGLLWLASLRWKLPPTFSPSEGRGLLDWLHLEVAHPTVGLYADFVAGVVIPIFSFSPGSPF